MSSVYDPSPNPRRKFPLFQGDELTPATAGFDESADLMGPMRVPDSVSQPASSTSVMAPATDGNASRATMGGATGGAPGSAAPTWRRPPPKPPEFEPQPELGPVDRILGPDRNFRTKVELARDRNNQKQKAWENDYKVWQEEQTFDQPDWRPQPGMVNEAGQVGLFNTKTGETKSSGMKHYEGTDKTLSDQELFMKDPKLFEQYEGIKAQVKKKFGADVNRTQIDAMREMYRAAGKTDKDLINDMNSNKEFGGVIKIMELSMEDDPLDPMAPKTFNPKKFTNYLDLARSAAGWAGQAPHGDRPNANAMPENEDEFRKDFRKDQGRDPTPAETRVWRKRRGTGASGARK